MIHIGAALDSSAPTSAIHKDRTAGGRGLRQTISNITASPLSGLATGPPHYREQVRSSVLCVTAPLFPDDGKAGRPTIIFQRMSYLTRLAGKRAAANCHMFVKGLSAVV